MSDTPAMKPASKRQAEEHERDGVDGKKQKTKETPTSSVSSPTEKARADKQHSAPEVELRDDAMDLMRNIDIELDRLCAMPLPDEREDITKELDTGSHMLRLEHSESKSSKCRAFKCLVEQYDEKIRSPYRLRLYAIRPSDAHWSQLEKPNIRFFHVSCFEAIGVDMAKYVTLQARREPSLFGCTIHHHHPAIVDWVANKGKAFDAELYSGDYEAALETYHKDVDYRAFVGPSLTCSGGECACRLPPVRPKSSDFWSGEPSECRLIDVMLRALGAGHLMPLSQRNQIKLLEVWGHVPSSLSKAALDAAKQKETQDEGKGVEDAEKLGSGSVEPGD